MAMNIPNQLPTGMASFDQGFKGMGDFMHRLKQHQLEQEKLQEIMRQHQQEMQFKKRADSRQQGLYGERLKGLHNKNALMDWVMQGMNGQGQGQGQGQETTTPILGGQNPFVGRGQSNGGHPPVDNQDLGMNDPNTGILGGEHNPDMGLMGQQVQMGQQEHPMQPQAQQPQQPQGVDWSNPINQMRYQMATGHPFPKPIETPEQKQQRALETNEAKLSQSENIAERKENRKITQNIEDTAVPLLSAAHHIAEIEKILKKHPNATGPVAGRFPNSPFSDSATIAAINTHAVPLQSRLAHELGARGGYGVSQLAESAKPSGKLSYAANMESVKANKDMIWQSYNQMKTDYERHNPGKKFPYKLPKSFYVTIISPNGKKVEMDPDQAEWALENGGRRG